MQKFNSRAGLAFTQNVRHLQHYIVPHNYIVRHIGSGKTSIVSARLLSSFCLLSGALFVTSCQNNMPFVGQISPDISVSSRQVSTRASRIMVQSRPEYKKAEILVREDKRAEAAVLLTNLLKLPTVSQADKDFLEKQIAICQSKEETITPNIASSNTKPNPSTLLDANCGARALTLAAKELGVKADIATLTKAAHTDANGANLEGLEEAAKSIGLKSESVQVDKDALENLPTPAIAWWEGNHYVALLKIDKNTFTGTTTARIHDPNNTELASLPLTDVLAKSGGIFITLKK